jgi:hypothetical protein
MGPVPGARLRADPELTALAERCGALLPDTSPHAEQVKPSDTAPASSARADWRRFRWLFRSRT